MLSNNRPSEYWAGTMLHEFGHALYDIQRRPGPAVAAAQHAPAHHRGRRDAVRAARPRRRMARAGRRSRRSRSSTTLGAAAWPSPAGASLLTFARWVLVMTHFERGLYADPDADHDRPLVGARRALPARAPPRQAATHPTGPRRSTSRSRPSTTRTTSTASWSRHSSTPRCASAAAASSIDPTPAALLCRRVLRARASTLRWDTLVERPPASRSPPVTSPPSSHDRADSPMCDTLCVVGRRRDAVREELRPAAGRGRRSSRASDRRAARRARCTRST